ncbi:MAG: cytochrome c oxidase subunit 3, partial [Pseudomonadota bacterium]|nr:cytochrome c oxidase subunit 3 [Pseudomonadota bacterium]
MAQAHSPNADVYFIPHSSRWPFLGSIALFVTMIGFANWLNEVSWGMWMFFIGVAALIAVLFGWFGDVIAESIQGRYNSQVDTSFRMGMVWFIFSEVMFFAAFFGALFYARQLALPWLGGAGDGIATNELLWPDFTG